MDKIIIRIFEKVMRSQTINYFSQIFFNVLNSMYKCAYLYADNMLMMVFPPKENNLTKSQYQTWKVLFWVVDQKLENIVYCIPLWLFIINGKPSRYCIFKSGLRDPCSRADLNDFSQRTSFYDIRRQASKEGS